MHWEGRHVVHSLNLYTGWKYEEGKREGKNIDGFALTHFEWMKFENVFCF